MTALKNQLQKARVVLQALLHGLHPVTGDELPREDIVNDIEVNRAMAMAVTALDQMVTKLTRREALPDKVGNAWTAEEEQQLKHEFNRTESVADMAITHGRTFRAIEARLERLGLLRADQRTTQGGFVSSPARKEEGK
jgi:hypothetical protein